MLFNIKKKSRAVFILVASLTLFSCDSDDNNTAQIDNFSITLSAKNTVPEISATGSGSASLSLNRDSGALNGSVTASGLTGSITSAHIHQGIAGSTGGIIVTLVPDSGNASQYNVPAGTILSSIQISEINNSEFYFNVHTATNASGEIRGQVIAANQEVIRVELSGDLQVPSPVTSSNSGVAFLTVNTATGEIRGSVKNTGLDDADAIHLHNGFAGTTGGVVTTLSQDTDVSVWNVPASTTLDNTQLNNLLNGAMYFNVHTPAFDNGEIRGQVAPENIKITRDELDGNQSVPAVTTAATGIGYTTVNETDGSITTNIRTSSITATAAHIHQGASGNTGAFILTFLQDGTDTDFWSVTGTLDNNQLTSFTNSELYFNVHSDAHASGELRSQINY